VSLRLGVWPQLLADRCRLLGVETPAERPSEESAEVLKARAWDVERTISSPHSEDLQGDAILWLTSKYRVAQGGMSFAAAWAELVPMVWDAQPSAELVADEAPAQEPKEPPAPSGLRQVLEGLLGLDAPAEGADQLEAQAAPPAEAP
jgi:hypothetical protein